MRTLFEYLWHWRTIRRVVFQAIMLRRAQRAYLYVKEKEPDMAEASGQVVGWAAEKLDEQLHALPDHWVGGRDVPSSEWMDMCIRAGRRAELNRLERHDWAEDFELEDGNYQNTCADCGVQFMGHKRRRVCKACASSGWVSAGGVNELD